MENGKSVLLLGGTGAMGRPLQVFLREAGYSVFVTSRRDHRDDKVTFFKGDANDEGFLGGVLSQRRFDAVVDFMIHSATAFPRVLQTILPRTEQYVFVSSARVYAPSDGALTESSPRILDVCTDRDYLQTDEYALSKARQENMLQSYGGVYKNWTIVRPSITYNTDRLQYPLGEKEEWLYRALQGRSVVIPDNMPNIYTTLTRGDDVAAALAKMICNPKALGETVHIAGAPAITWREVMEIYDGVLRELKGINLRIKYVEGYEKLAKDLGRYYQIKYARAVNRRFDNGKLESIAGKFDFIPPQTGLRACLSSFLNGNGKFGDVSWRAEAYFDRISRERSSLAKFGSVKRKFAYLVARYTPFLHGGR